MAITCKLPLQETSISSMIDSESMIQPCPLMQREESGKANMEGIFW